MADRRAKPEVPAFGVPDPRRGWQIIYPVGTFPILFHPALARALPFVILAATAAPTLLGNVWGWSVPLIIWAGLAIPLSIPIVQWVAFAWGLHRIQAALPALAMVLLAGQVASGASAQTMLAVPVLFFAAHLGLAIGGRVRLRHIVRANASLDANAGRRGALPPLLIDARDRRALPIETVLAALALPIGFRRDRKGAWRAVVRVAATEADNWLTELRRSIDVQTVNARDRTTIVTVPECAPPARTLRVRVRRAPLLVRLALGPLEVMEASIGGERRCYLSGPAAPLLWYPGFVLFLSGYFSGRATWRAGFVRGPAVRLGEGLHPLEIAVRATAPLRGPDATPLPPLAARAELETLVADVLSRRAQAALVLLDAIIAAPLAGHRGATSVLRCVPERLAERAPALIAALENAAALAPKPGDRAARDVINGPVEIARAIAMLPDDAFHPIAPRLLAVLAEPIMASGDRMRFGGGDARSLHVSNNARFRGFTMLFHAEALYPRLAATLGEAARPTIDRLISQYGLIPPLAVARRHLDA